MSNDFLNKIETASSVVIVNYDGSSMHLEPDTLKRLKRLVKLGLLVEDKILSLLNFLLDKS